MYRLQLNISEEIHNIKLGQSYMNDNDVDHVMKLFGSKLKKIELETYTTDKSLESIGKYCPNVTNVSIGDECHITDDGKNLI